MRRLKVELWSHPWWIIGLYSLTGLFFLLFALLIASYRTLRGELSQGSGIALASTSIESTPLGYTTLGQMGIGSTAIAGATRQPKLNTWVNRIFIAIVLQCAAIYLISAYPGTRSPFWLGITLQGFTYGSAAVYYASWGKEPYED